jgi:hypothetical protein
MRTSRSVDLVRGDINRSNASVILICFNTTRQNPVERVKDSKEPASVENENLVIRRSRSVDHVSKDCFCIWSPIRKQTGDSARLQEPPDPPAASVMKKRGRDGTGDGSFVFVWDAKLAWFGLGEGGSFTEGGR